MQLKTVSVRMLWPFMRVMRDFGPEMRAVQSAGIQPTKLADPSERVNRGVARDVIRGAIERTGDEALGVHAGECTEPADFGVTGHAVRACPDVRRAIFCMGRYGRLQDEAIEAHFVERRDRVEWQVRNIVAPVLPAANDFQVTVVVMTLLSLVGPDEPPLEVHLQHATPTDTAEYARVFRAPVRMGAPHNAVVIRRSLLDQPVLSASPQVFSIFDGTAKKQLERLNRTDTAPERVRHLVARRLGHAGIGIRDIGAELRMSPATLRRRLEEEGMTYREIVDGLRRDLASEYLVNRGLAIGEIAQLLGFSNQGAFSRSYRRWNGFSAAQWRQRMRVGKSG